MDVHRAIALTISPITVAAVTSIVLLRGMDLLVAIILLVVLPPAPIIFRSIKDEGGFDLLVPDRFMRGKFFLFALISYLLATVYFHLRKATLGTMLSLSYLLVTASMYLLNKRLTKVSVHAAGIAGPSTLLTCIGKLEVAVALWALTPVVLWSRWKSKSHSMGQLALGVTLAVILTLLVYWTFLPVS